MDRFEAGPFENGAAILASRDARGQARYEIHHGEGGTPIRIMCDRDEAVAYAQALPALDLPPVIPPSPYNVSPRAHARREALGLDVYEPVPEPKDGAPDRSMSPARARAGAGPSDRRPEIAPRPRTTT